MWTSPTVRAVDIKADGTLIYFTDGQVVFLRHETLYAMVRYEPAVVA